MAQTWVVGLLSLPGLGVDDSRSWRHWIPMATTGLGFLGACVMPCVRATAALLPAAGEVEGVDAGCLLGALYLLDYMTSQTGAQVFLPLYRSVEHHFPALPFYVSGALGVVALAWGTSLPDLAAIERKAERRRGLAGPSASSAAALDQHPHPAEVSKSSPGGSSAARSTGPVLEPLLLR